MTVAIPVRFENEEASPGLKRGGVLNVVQHEIELIATRRTSRTRCTCRSTGWRSAIRSTSATSSFRTVPYPAIDDRDFTVATIVAPSAMKSEEEEAAATAEGEVPTVGRRSRRLKKAAKRQLGE